MRTSFTHPVLPECLNVYTFPIYNFSFTSYTIKKLKNKNKKLFSSSLNTLTMSLMFSFTSISLNSKPRKEGKIPPMGPTIIVTRGCNRHPQSNLNPYPIGIYSHYIRVRLVGSVEKWGDKKWGGSGIGDG